ncbi:uncharacterized protein [Populus alba]|uniref:uncharacterized protein isoform X1 n=1 Tax=Populus alba TaxID=43335 RepID=UPI00158C4AB7|nr:disease resistance protein RUN1-like isoform X1 [Populus alba]
MAMPHSLMVSSSPAALRLHWDVFLSFRGEDTRYGFTKNLYDSLSKQDIRVFLDDSGMAQGDEIAPTLMEAIEDSALSIIILSPRYANSHWCLEELARICELRRLILPVFYQVDPSHVRRQKGPLEQDFMNHMERFGEEKVGKWREAMNKVGGISGFVYDTRSEDQLIRRLGNRVTTELRKTPVGIATYTVGLDSRVEDLKKRFIDKSNRVQVLGLYGMGGIGKTTLATALFNKLVGHFESRSFILNVKEISKEDGGLVKLQNKLLGDLSSNWPLVDNIDKGIDAIKRLVHEKRVLIVLDDVADVSQLNALAGNRSWFGEGSRVIVTTRNKDVLAEHLVNEFYEVRELGNPEALQLFSYHALRKDKPTAEYMDISNKIVSLTGRLPLALEVFGSTLFNARGLNRWEDALKKLQRRGPDDLQYVLRISYDELDEDGRHVFLDIACLFIKMGMKREEAIDILKGCGFSAETVITDLTSKCLIKIREDDELWMHDQLRDMGRQIVQHESPCSRLWDRGEILSTLMHKKGTERVQGIVFDFEKKKYTRTRRISWVRALNPCSALAYLIEKCKIFLRQGQEGGEKKKYTRTQWISWVRALNPCLALAYLIEKCKIFLRQGQEEGEMILDTEGFKSMVNLRLLQINHAKLQGKFKNFPAGLKWLQWKNCPMKNLPSDYAPHELAVLDLSESGIERVWGWTSNKVAKNLMVMDLHRCYNLVACPDLSGCKTLEKLNLQGCVRLTKVHKSVGNARTLLQLNLNDCSNLVEFPSDVSGLKALQNLNLSNCPKLKELPQEIGSMYSLKQLLVDETAISVLPESIFRLEKLEKLSLNGCQFIKRLPKHLGNLTSLKELSLNQSAVEELPDSVGSLSNLEKLSLMWCQSLTAIPESVGNLHLLTEVSINSSAIKELPLAIGSLPYLKILSAGGCRSLSKLPDSIGGLASISELELDETSISHLPEQIGGLKMIEKLYMRKCTSLRSLPESIGSMLSLTTLNLFGCNINELPESFGMLENLVMLRLHQCRKLQKLPVSIGKLKSLCHLLMEKTAVTVLPESFGKLSNLMILKMRKEPLESPSTQEHLVVLPNSFFELSLLEELNARAWRISGKIPDDFEKLSSLEIVDLGHNNFSSLPSSLCGLSLLRELHLPHCEELESLPPLPSSLEEVDVSNCFALETMSDVSNLGSLTSLNMTNCEKVVDIPGIECLKSLKWLYMSNCKACSLTVKRRLSKVCLRNIRNLSMPGSKIPDWFSQEDVKFSERRNREIKAVIIGVVVSLDRQIPEQLRYCPVVPDIQANLLDQNKPIFSTTLYLQGIPKTHEDQIHLCRYSHFNPLVLMLKDGSEIQVRKRKPPVIEGVELKKCGIHLVYENEDDYGGNEESLDESQQSVSQKLANFFNSYEEDSQVC